MYNSLCRVAIALLAVGSLVWALLLAWRTAPGPGVLLLRVQLRDVVLLPIVVQESFPKLRYALRRPILSADY